MKILDSTALHHHLFTSPAYDRPDLIPESSTKPLCPESFHHLLAEIDTFVFDADGVLWLADEVIPGSPELLDFLLKNNKQIIILTNNTTKSRAEYARKLARLGFNRKLDKNFSGKPCSSCGRYLT
ncbi:hypothetical protein OESDEN_19153 [Oesophagostomum dentatum]|uniref:Uncharacterized protein n=1 Tax=Oesophagostomum dentatum TaxID=61180 RepID=A0A0B1SBD0_OESDE|nr:hypothetical protein OESDEN_19153 [Oesophagostomum dentatum]